MFSSSERRNYEKVLDAIYSGSGFKGELTLGKWCDRTRSAMQAAKVLTDDIKRRYDSEKSIYSNAENEKRWKEYQTEKTAFEDAARTMIQRDLDAVIEAKRAAYSKAMGAPTDENIRLLQTLQMRKNLTAAEIAAAAEHLNGNLQALSVLGEIAKSNDILFPKLHTDFASIETELRENIDQLLNGAFSDNPPYIAALFKAESGNNGTLRPLVDIFDAPAYLDTSEIRDKGDAVE